MLNFIPRSAIHGLEGAVDTSEKLKDSNFLINTAVNLTIGIQI